LSQELKKEFIHWEETLFTSIKYWLITPLFWLDGLSLLIASEKIAKLHDLSVKS
jgi:hypothetical protein